MVIPVQAAIQAASATNTDFSLIQILNLRLMSC
jgi:hypothetical protein